MRDWKEEYGFPPRMCLPSMRDWTEWTPPSTCFEPLTAIGTIASIGGTIAGAGGKSQEYGATAAEARYRAQVAENNRIVAEQNARYAIQAGRTNAQAQDLQTAALIRTGRVARGAGLIDPTVGSPVEVERSMGQIGRLKTLQEIQESEKEAYAYRQKASDFEAEKGLQQYKAASAERAKSPAMFGTLLAGAGGLAGKWAKWQDPFGGSSSTGGGSSRPFSSWWGA
jgi:hypothetical protein